MCVSKQVPPVGITVDHPGRKLKMELSVRSRQLVAGPVGPLGEGAGPVFTAGARYPLAGLLLVLPALEGTGLLDCARDVYGRLRNGYYGLAATLLTLVFLALAGEPLAEGATRVPPGALGRVPGLDRAPEVKTIRRKLAELASAGKAHELVMALARRHAAARPDALGFLYADGHARAYFGTRKARKTHIARLKFPAPATEETWVTDQDGDPVLVVIAEPSGSLAGELRRLLPDLRQVAGEGRRVTVCFDRGGWSPALFADILDAGSGLLTWRKGPAPDLPAAEFTTIKCADDRGREHEYDLAGTTAELGIAEGPRKGQPRPAHRPQAHQRPRRPLPAAQPGPRPLPRNQPRPALRSQNPPRPCMILLPMSGVLIPEIAWRVAAIT